MSTQDSASPKVTVTGTFLVYVGDEPPRKFEVEGGIAYLSYARLTGEWPESVFVEYGSALPDGTHTKDYAAQPGARLDYRDPEGTEHFRPKSGKLTVIVERPPFGGDFKHHGTLENVTFSDSVPIVKISGSYTASSD